MFFILISLVHGKKKCSYCSYNLHFPYCHSRYIFIAHLASFFSVHIFCPLFCFICLYLSVCRIYLYISARNSSFEFSLYVFLIWNTISYSLCVFSLAALYTRRQYQYSQFFSSKCIFLNFIGI